MEPTLGWTVLSREALRRAEAQLQQETEEVRDEIGFLNLHQAYANRFFPGTTVLQTRLRYVLFIPWMYNKVASARNIPSAGRAVEDEERVLIRRLKCLGSDQGIIGGRNELRVKSQPASVVYWSALQMWGILRRLPDGSLPTRGQIHSFIERHRELASIKDDDQYPLEERSPLFVTLPKPPETWPRQSEPLDFLLLEEEANWLRKQLMGVGRNGLPQDSASVLAVLADVNLPLADIHVPWAPEIIDTLYEEEQSVMVRAGQISALSAIGRAVYEVLVEFLRSKDDPKLESTARKEFLDGLIQSDYAESALKVDLEKITFDAPHLKGHRIIDVLSATQEWLRQRSDFKILLDLYRSVECSRKGRKAQLQDNLAGKQRRAEWNPGAVPYPAPLSYRWSNVKRLMHDLRVAL